MALLTTLFNTFYASLWLKRVNQTSWIHETLSEPMKVNFLILECLNVLNLAQSQTTMIHF